MTGGINSLPNSEESQGKNPVQGSFFFSPSKRARALDLFTPFLFTNLLTYQNKYIWGLQAKKKDYEAKMGIFIIYVMYIRRLKAINALYKTKQKTKFLKMLFPRGGAAKIRIS